MELDRTKPKRDHPGVTCYLCRNAGHIKRDCPRKVDVRLFDDDELEEEMARRRDEAEALRHHQEVLDSGAQTEEDFGTPNP